MVIADCTSDIFILYVLQILRVIYTVLNRKTVAQPRFVVSSFIAWHRISHSSFARCLRLLVILDFHRTHRTIYKNTIIIANVPMTAKLYA